MGELGEEHRRKMAQDRERPGLVLHAGLALLLAPTICAFTLGKGAWLQHRAQTLALWCMFAQTFPTFQDASRFRVDSAYNPAVYNVISGIALAFNLGVFVYMLVRVIKAKKSPYGPEIYADLPAYQKIKSLAE